MIQKTKTRDGVLLEDDAGASVQLSWEDVGELLVFIEEDLAAVGAAQAVETVASALERGMQAERERAE